MNELIIWIKKHTMKTSIIALLIFILPLIIVQCLFKWEAGIPWLEAEWEAGELLGYIAGFETLLATTILSYVALSQTQQIKKSEEFSEYADIKRPFFIIDRVIVKENKREIGVKFRANRSEHTSSSSAILYVYLKNVGDGIANQCSYEPYGFGELPVEYKPMDCILLNERYCVPCRLPAKNGDYVTEIITINYQNVLGFRYKQILIINAESIPIPCGQEPLEIDNRIEMETEYYEGQTTYINLISPQVPMGFANNINN